MRLIAVNRYYRPDGAPTARLLGDLAEHVVGTGLAVTVVASRRRYRTDGPLPAHRERCAGVAVRRVGSARPRGENLVLRALDDAAFGLRAATEVVRLAHGGDVVLVSTDPPLLCLPIWMAATLRRAKLVVWCHDLFPETAAALGVRGTGGIANAVLRALRNRCYRSAAFVAVLTAAVRDRLIAEGIDARKLKILPNWAEPGLAPVPRERNALRAGWRLEGRSVIAYSGNLGRAHMPDRIADLVIATAAIPDLVWLFVASGSGLPILRRRLADAGACNVVFQPPQPAARLAASLSTGDAHLVALDPKCEGLVMPSKVYGVLAVGRPILFLGDPSGAVAGELADAQLGRVLPVGAPETWCATVGGLLTDLARDAATMSRAILDHHRGYRADAALERWTAALKPLGATARAPRSRRHGRPQLSG